MDMRALYYIVLPTERGEHEDIKQYEDDIKSNENKLNQNFTITADKIYEFEIRLANLESMIQDQSGSTSP